MDIGMLETGTAEQQALLRKLAQRVRKAERRRAVIATIAMQDFEDAREDTSAAAEFLRDMRGADERFRNEFGAGVKDVFTALAGCDPDEMMINIARLIVEHQIIGVEVRDDGSTSEVKVMTPDGAIDMPDELSDAVLRVAKVPGMAPPGMADMIESLARAVDAVDADTDPDTTPLGSATIEGIDLDLEIEEPEINTIRDFDGGLG